LAFAPVDASATLSAPLTLRIEADEDTRRELAMVDGIWLEGPSRWSAVVVDWTGLGVLSHERIPFHPGLPAMKSVLHMPPSEVTQSMIKDGIALTSCVVRFDIDAYGHVANARIAESSGYRGADEAALKSIQTFEYGPAAKAGRPVPLHTDRRFEWMAEYRPK
jgi:TonB family protein